MTMRDSNRPNDIDLLNDEGKKPSITPSTKSKIDEGNLNEKSTEHKNDIRDKDLPNPLSSNSLPEVLASISAASINLHVGLILAYSAILVPELQKPTSDISATSSEISWIASIISLLAPVGSIFAGFSMDCIGRMWTLQLSMIPVTLGWIIIALSQNVFHLVIGRCLCGFSMSMGANAANVYIAEVSRPSLRGSLMSVGSLFISLGMLVIYFQGYFIPSWRITAWLCVAYGFIPSICIFIFCSPSPLWLVLRDRYDDAFKSLKFLLRKEFAQKELANIKLKELITEKELRERKNDTRSYLKKFFDATRKPQTFKPFWILIVLFFLQQFSGLYVILVFAVSFFSDMIDNKEPQMAYFLSIVLGVMRLIMGGVTTYALKTYGRRKLCIFSGVVMMISMFLSGYILYGGLKEHPIFKWVPIVCILVFIGAGSLGLLTLPWMISAELFPNEVRGVIQGPVMAWANIVMFAAIKSYNSLHELLGGTHKVHWFFGFMSFVSIVFVWLFLPETHNRKLIEIEHYFRYNCCYITRNEEADRKISVATNKINGAVAVGDHKNNGVSTSSV